MESKKGFFGRIGGGIAAFFRAIWRFVKHHKGLSIFLLIVVIGASVLLSALSRAAAALAGASDTGVISASPLTRMDLELSVTATGTVETAKGRDVTTSLAYEVKELYVSVGDAVTEGQALCLLDGTELDETIADLYEDIAEAQDSDAKQLSRLAETLSEAINRRDSNWASNDAIFEDAHKAVEQARKAAGDTALAAAAKNAAEKGETVLAADNAVSAASTALSAAQAKLAEFESVYQRIAGEKELYFATEDAAVRSTLLATFPFPYATETELTDAFTEAETKLNAEKQNLQIDALNQALIDANSARDTAYRTAYDAFAAANRAIYHSAYDNAEVSALITARDKAAETRDTAAESDAKTVKTAQQNYDDQRAKNSAEALQKQLEGYLEDKEELLITSPIAGTVTAMTAEVGEKAASGGGADGSSAMSGSLFTVEDAGTLEIPVSVEEYDAMSITEGLSASVTSDALEGEEWDARVTSVSPTASSGYFTVTVSVTSPAEQLALGMSVTVNIITESREDVFAVPYDAVVTNDSGQTVVYALENSGFAFSGGPDADGMQRPDMADGEFTVPEDGFTMPEGEMPEDFQANFQAGSGDGGTAEETRTEIPVEVGFETDYYVEISGDGLSEGLMIITDPLGLNADTASTDSFSSMMGMPGGMGGGAMGGGEVRIRQNFGG